MRFNPRSPCGERHQDTNYIVFPKRFNPRSPCGERPGVPDVSTLTISVSTHAHASALPHQRGRFNPRSPCGERPCPAVIRVCCSLVSTHAPLAGSDTGIFTSLRARQMFQPTLPLRGATSEIARHISPCNVSTHAPLAGSDLGGRS